MCRPIPLSEFRLWVRNLYSATGKTKSTVKRLDQMLAELSVALGPAATTADLTTAGIAAWMALFAPRRASATVVGHLSNLRTICAMAWEEGWLERTPAWKRLRPKGRPPATKRHHSRAELVILLRYLRTRVSLFADWESRRLYAAMAVAIYTGMRRDELLCLRVIDVDLVAGMISIVPLPCRGLKTEASERTVPIPPELGVVLAAWIPFADPLWLFPGIRHRGPWRGGKVGCRPVDALRRACIAAGIAAGTWQWMRRAWATHAETGLLLPDGAIERILGHTTPRVSRKHYCQVDLDNLRAIGRLISYDVTN